MSYYASSSEPAQVQGKTVYLQYSNMQEIMNNKTTADVSGNLSLLFLHGYSIPELGPCSLKIRYSAHTDLSGSKTSFRILDIQMAVIAKEALERHCICDGCKLHMSYSRHTDLSIKSTMFAVIDYKMPARPMLNLQHSILVQQPPSGAVHTVDPSTQCQCNCITFTPICLTRMALHKKLVKNSNHALFLLS